MPKLQSLKARLLTVLVIVGPLLLLFGPILARNDCFTLRDAGYYYYPMYEWNVQQWQQGSPPLWNPLENIGTPVVSDATAAVFYPGQIVFHMPLLAFATKFVLYVGLHLLLAAFGVYRLCRALGTTRNAATLGALAFSLGGSVLFQHCNVIFLVGAAWLPWVMASGYAALKKRCLRNAAGCSLCMAMMVLGGDPQSAYHAGLALALLAIIIRQIEKRKATNELSAANSDTRIGFAKNRFVVLSSIAVLAAMFSAVQILPSAEWSSRSQRRTFVVPRTIYEVPPYLERDSNVGWYGVNFGLTGSPLPGTHHHHAYQFSNPPWVFTELFFPNVGGAMDSVNRRWSHSLPGVDRMWTPSIYLGLLPAMLALSFFSFRSQNIGVRWMSWLVLLFAVGSLGWYGIGWIVHEIAYSMFGVTPDKIPIGAGTGGLYWFMVKVLPGYVYFRYPAKLFVVAALGISTLAAFGFDRLIEKPNFRWNVLKIGLPIVSSMGLLAAAFLGGTIMRSSAARPDFFFGPLDLQQAGNDLRNAFLQTFVVSSAMLALLHFKQRSPKFRAGSLAAGLLLLTTIELLIANHSMIETGPANLWTESSGTASRIHQESQPTAAAIPPRIFRGQIWLPRQWAEQSSPDRLKDSIRFNRKTIFPKHQLQEEIGVVESFTSMAPYDYWAYMTVARTGGFMRSDSMIEPNIELLEVLSTEQLLLPQGNIDREGVPGASDFVLAKIETPYPRCWLTTNCEVLPILDSSDPDIVGQRTRDVLLDRGNVRNFRQTCVIETNDNLELESTESNDDSDNKCKIIEYSATRIVIETQTQSDSVLVVNDYYDDGWKASISDKFGSTKKPAKIYRANRIMRGVIVPSGDNRIELEYQPRSFQIGLCVSIIAFLLAGLAIGVDSIRSERRLRNG